MNMPKELDALKDYFVGLPTPLIGAKTIQLIIAREVHDFSIFRTEDTGELNNAITPESLDNNKAVLRVAFLGSKQKAPETRMARALLNTAYAENKIHKDPCYHKDGLCLSCPRCILFGAVKTKGVKEGARQIKHRIIYSSAYSLLPYDMIEVPITFNAIDERTQSTEQALGTKYTVTPSTFFPSIVDLREITWKEFILYVKTLLATKQYGAEGRIHGGMRNKILGIVAGWESIITPLELTLILYQQYTKNTSDTFVIDSKAIKTVINEYKGLAAFSNKVKVLDENETDNVIRAVSEFEFTKEFLEKFDEDVEEFKKEQGKKS